MSRKLCRSVNAYARRSSSTLAYGMAMPLRRRISKISSGSSEPSMWMCSSAFGMRASSCGRLSAGMFGTDAVMARRIRYACRVITSLLDTDLYKFTMWQAMLHGHPQTAAEYEFVCRNETRYPLADLLGEVNAALDELCTLRFSDDELDYLASLRYIKSDFVDFLRLFHFQRPFIRASAEGGRLRIHARGPQVHITAFEIPVLAIVNELYFRRFDAARALATGRALLERKIARLEPLAKGTGRAFPLDISDFGTRRRYSAQWHREVVTRLQGALTDNIKGTSIVLLARDLGLTPIGTMAHEYLQTFQNHNKQQHKNQRAAHE